MNLCSASVRVFLCAMYFIGYMYCIAVKGLKGTTFVCRNAYHSEGVWGCVAKTAEVLVGSLSSALYHHQELCTIVYQFVRLR